MSPRAFSDADRAAVRARLLAAATVHFARYGYRGASVAAIAAECGIGKGTVYLFSPSKAELFVEALREVEGRMRARLVEEMRSPFPTPRERVRHFLRFQAEALREHPLLRVLLDPGEAAALMGDLRPERLDALRADDDAFYAALAEGWASTGEVPGADPRMVAALPRALLALLLQREMIGADVFPALLDLVVDALSDRLAPS